MNQRRVLAPHLFAVALAAAALLSLSAAASAAAARHVPPRFLGTVADGPLFDEAALSAAGTSLERELDLMVAAGVESVRLSFYWAPMQPYASWDQVSPAERPRFRGGAGVPTDFEATDRIVQLAAERGLALLPVVLRAPDWAARFPGQWASPPADPRTYAAFVRALAERYGRGGSFWRERPRLRRLPLTEWQIWNEPTMQSFWLTQPFASDYVALLRATRRALDQADRRARIVLAGLVYESWDALDKVYRAGGRRWFDALALHPFTRRPDDVLRIVERNRTVMARHRDGGKPIYLSELSWPSSRGRIPVRYGYETDERGQARRLTAALRLLAANRRRLGLRRVYWYTWLTRETHPDYPFDYAGLRRLQPARVRSKPALGAYRRTALRLEGCAAKGRTATRCRR
jgi:polysaccharide biosynthesis protein PslG